MKIRYLVLVILMVLGVTISIAPRLSWPEIFWSVLMTILHTLVLGVLYLILRAVLSGVIKKTFLRQLISKGSVPAWLRNQGLNILAYIGAAGFILLGYVMLSLEIRTFVEELFLSTVGLLILVGVYTNLDRENPLQDV